jgi:CMP-N,N'-diacetyllegionaminic acid synthase
LRKEYKILILIPARGGSKGLPGKNIRPLNGKPLIAWTIETAMQLKEKYDSRVVVSTDSTEIAEVSKTFGAEVPFMRPPELARDESTSMDVVLHALDFFEKQNLNFDLVCMLEATSPQRDQEDLNNAIDLLLRTPTAESIVGVCKSESGHPAFLAKKNKQEFISPYQANEFKFLRRQEIDEVYFFEGSLYISYVESLKKRKSFYHEKTLGFEMPKWKSFEVDDLTDFMIIERLMLAKKEGQI